jgi:hypothetical protein
MNWSLLELEQDRDFVPARWLVDFEKFHRRGLILIGFIRGLLVYQEKPTKRWQGDKEAECAITKS